MDCRRIFHGVEFAAAGTLCFVLTLFTPVSLTGAAAPPDPAEAKEKGRQLVEALQMATLEKKEGAARKYIQRARALVEEGADVQAKDEQGRTALHWIAIGTSQFRIRNTHRAYRELAEILIDAGIDVNAEDDYGNTALDWEEANPQDALRYVLEQADAQRGFSHKESERLADFIGGLRQMARKRQFNALASTLEADVPEGTHIWVRLAKPLSSKISRCGEKLEAVVMAPAMANGRVVLSPGTRVEGTLLSVRNARNRFVRAEALPEFANFLHEDGARTRLAVQLVEVDNARETVHHGRILGVPFPNEAVGRWTIGLRGLGFVLPGVSEGLRWSTQAYNLTLGREIHYPEGVEMILRVAVPEKLATKAPQKGWKEIPAPADLVELVQKQPMRVKTPSGEDSDIVNLMFLGAQEDLETGFRMAGWVEARSLGVKSGLITALQALRKNGYSEAPFSLLQLEGKDPDYEYQKGLNTVTKRHHLRVFRREETWHGHTVWVASATHDIGIGVGRKGTHWYHLIDPEIDKERQKIADDLLFTGVATGYTLVDRPDAPRRAGNATGDELRTDGRMMVLHMNGERKAARAAALSPRAGTGRGN
ncbi:MAG: LssY C-terminal domain-containing protein [Bryobacteraceae bacterium]